MPDNLASLLILLSILVILSIVYSYVRWKSRTRCAEKLAALLATWGKPTDGERDFALLRSLWGMYTQSFHGKHLDDQTWEDLNLDLIFENIDRTHCLPGQIVLYHWLRTPETRRAVLSERDRMVALFQKNVALRQSVQLELSRLGRTRFPSGILELLWGELPRPHRFRLLYSLLAILVMVCLGTAALLVACGWPWGRFAMLSLGILWPLNMFIHYRTRNIISERILSIRYLGKMVAAARKIGCTQLAGLEDKLQSLARCSTAAKKIPLVTALLVPERAGAVELSEVLQEYVTILFLVEVRSYYKVIEEIRKCGGMLREIFQTFGELDALQAIASFREGLPSYAIPEFQAEGRVLNIREAVHPLLASAVANSISLADRGCLITGSNMSGKSTFLRTLGVNVVLAQSVLTCPAASYRGSLFHVITSLSQTDALVEGKSLYLVEAERLLAVIRQSEGSIPCLCLVDEILCGTNSVERLAAAKNILEYLAGRNAVIVAATHDIELVDRLSPWYSSYHFTDEVGDQGLHFDYQLRQGKATTTNAIRLLEYLGYPSEIINKARTDAFGSQPSCSGPSAPATSYQHNPRGEA